MTTATAHQPPSGQEIRTALANQLEAGKSSGTTGDNLRSELRSLIRDVASPISNPAWLAIEAEPALSPEVSDEGDLWCDLRTSEARRLRALYQDAIERAAGRCEAAIVEELTAAGVQFAAEHPEAPRP